MRKIGNVLENNDDSFMEIPGGGRREEDNQKITEFRLSDSNNEKTEFEKFLANDENEYER